MASIFNQLLLNYQELLDRRARLESDCNCLSDSIVDQTEQIRSLKSNIKAEFQKIKQELAARKMQASSAPNAPPEDLDEGADEAREWKLTKLVDDDSCDLTSLSLLCEIAEQSPVSAARFSASGELLAFGGNHTLRVFSVTQDKVVLDLSFGESEGDTNFVRALEWCRSDELLIAGLEEGAVKIVDVASGDVVTELNGGKREVFDIKLSKDRKLLAFTNGDNGVSVYSCPGFEEVVSYENKGEIALINSICFDDSGKLIAIGLSSGNLLIWDIENNKVVCRMKCHQHSVFSILFIKDSKQLVTGSFDNTVKIWEISYNEDNDINLALVASISEHNDFVLSITTDTNYEWLISGSKDSTMKLFSLTEYKVIYSLQAHTNSILSLDFADKKGIFCSGSGDNTLMIWNFSSEKNKE